jgi:hypothetical protein
MTTEEASEFTPQLAVMLEAFGRRSTPAQQLGYVRAMRGIPLRAAMNAVQAALESPREHPPSPGQLRELALCGPGGYTARAEYAWTEFVEAVETIGADNSISFDDGLTNATVRTLGGWVECCEKTGDEFDKWLRRDFLAAYVRFCTSGASEELRQGHVGRLRRMNAGYTDAELRLLPNANCGVEVRKVATAVLALAPPAKLEVVPLLTDQREGQPVEHPVTSKARTPEGIRERRAPVVMKRPTVEAIKAVAGDADDEAARKLAAFMDRAAGRHESELKRYYSGEASKP